ncbi:MAG TPA: hypothetical protein VGB53_14495 [Rubricoccaceae bacterium]|jgi:hypothetical protein
MNATLLDLLPTAPDLGLYAGADIPPAKLAAAVRDYGRGVAPADVLALYDATRLGSAKDGALFLADRVVFQNNALHAPRAVRYGDLVGVRQTRSLLGGRSIEMDLNRARATVTEALDLSAHPGAAEYVERFLHEAMLSAGAPSDHPSDEPGNPPPGRASDHGTTDIAAVLAALDALVESAALAPADRRRMVEALQSAAVDVRH